LHPFFKKVFFFFKNKKMNVDEVCEKMGNRAHKYVLFEGTTFKVKANPSLCRQLYEIHGQGLNYEKFKQKLRFQTDKGWLVVTFKRDYTPLAGAVAGAATVGLGLAYGAHRYKRSQVPAVPAVAAEALYSPTSASPIHAEVHIGREQFSDSVEEYQIGLDPYASSDEKDEFVAESLGQQLVEDQPHVFPHVGNSCYFHASMLLLFQMRDWFLNLNDQNPLVQTLQNLVRDMTKPLVKNRVENDFDSVASILFPNEFLKTQQDAADFLRGVLTSIDDKKEIEVTPIKITRYSTEAIESLTCNKVKVNHDEVMRFKNDEWQKYRNVDKFTLNKEGKIVLKDRYIIENDAIKPRPGYVEADEVIAPIEAFVQVDGKYKLNTQTYGKRSNYGMLKGDLDNAPCTINRDSDYVDAPNEFNNTDSTYRTKTPILEIGLGVYTDVCQMVKDVSVGPDELQATSMDGELFYRKVITNMTYRFEKYIIIMLKFPKEDIGRLSNKQYTFCNVMQLNRSNYKLICVVHRRGSQEKQGHYTASLQIGDGWWHYDDIQKPPSPILQNPSNARGVPYLLLFKKME
jgi:hypothetical protein